MIHLGNFIRLFPYLFFIDAIRYFQTFAVIRNSDVLVSAGYRTFCHLSNGSVSVTPFRMHLQIAVYRPEPVRLLRQCGSSSSDSEELPTYLWRFRDHCGLVKPPLYDLFDVRTYLIEFDQRTSLPQQVGGF